MDKENSTELCDTCGCLFEYCDDDVYRFSPTIRAVECPNCCAELHFVESQSGANNEL